MRKNEKRFKKFILDDMLFIVGNIRSLRQEKTKHTYARWGRRFVIKIQCASIAFLLRFYCDWMFISIVKYALKKKKKRERKKEKKVIQRKERKKEKRKRKAKVLFYYIKPEKKSLERD